MSSGPLFTKPRSGALMFWAALAILNLAAGVIVSTQPVRLFDLESMMRWGRAWLVGGLNIYLPIGGDFVDYPPNAVVLLSPLGLLPFGLAVPFWVLLNIGLVCVAPYLAARFFRPHDPFRVIALPILMFLFWGGVRTLTQFSLLALTLSMAALVLADRRPIAAGALLGLAMMKPQVAVPVFLWSVFTRRWRVALTSTLGVLVLFAAFCVRAREDSPLLVLTQYANNLALYHTGDAILAGLSELRPLIRQWASTVSDVDAIAGSIGIGLLGGLCVAGFQEGSVRKRVLYAAPPLVACWSLLTFYHLTYGFIILLPVLMLLALNDAEHSSLRTALFWILQLGMMFDVSGLGRRAGLADTPFYTTVLVHADRVLILGLFVGLVALAWREPPGPAMVRPTPDANFQNAPHEAADLTTVR
ncbi:MAG: DUF2029 domain-containing protein [Acidobacteria bacterium]|nr:DUF2029 domain-containing protein [Acidobacteriota bacterium]